MKDTKKKIVIVIAILVVIGIVGYLLLNNQQVQENAQSQDQQDKGKTTKDPEGVDEKEGKETSTNPVRKRTILDKNEVALSSPNSIYVSGKYAYVASNGGVEMDEYDTLINSIVSLAEIDATLKAIELKKNIALANKETLVSTGEIVMKKARENGIEIMPIDSEHSALFQCLNSEPQKKIHRLIITCSGGALQNKTKEELKKVTVQDALGHKTWSMGQKITIDSATLMNKGFEVIEAMWLYDIPIEKIKVVVHPQSIIHSMIEYTDGSIIAQMSNPNMKLPIQYALSYPDRWDCPLERFDFSKDLTFDEPDLEKFPCLQYAFDAARKMGTLPAAMNAANDYMLKQFLSENCRFLDIQKVIKKVMDDHQNNQHPKLQDIKKTIEESKIKAQKFLAS